MVKNMASWDDEDFEPGATVAVSNNHWEGEDEDDDDIKDNWDDEDEEKEAPAVPKPEPKKKKTIGEKIKEKEERMRLEKIAKMEELKKMEENRELTPEEEMEEKLRRQKLQEEADLELAKDAFGVDLVVPDVVPGQKTIDNFVPSNKDEFLELSGMIVTKLSKLEDKKDFQLFLETLVRDCCAGLEADDIKKVSANLNVLVNEKQKLAKAQAGKGKKKAGAASKKTLSTGKGVKDDMDYDDGGYYNEYEDFM